MEYAVAGELSSVSVPLNVDVTRARRGIHVPHGGGSARARERASCSERVAATGTGLVCRSHPTNRHARTVVAARRLHRVGHHGLECQGDVYSSTRRSPCRPAGRSRCPTARRREAASRVRSGRRSNPRSRACEGARGVPVGRQPTHSRAARDVPRLQLCCSCGHRVAVGSHPSAARCSGSAWEPCPPLGVLPRLTMSARSSSARSAHPRLNHSRPTGAAERVSRAARKWWPRFVARPRSCRWELRVGTTHRSRC